MTTTATSESERLPLCDGIDNPGLLNLISGESLIYFQSAPALF